MTAEHHLFLLSVGGPSTSPATSVKVPVNIQITDTHIQLNRSSDNLTDSNSSTTTGEPDGATSITCYRQQSIYKFKAKRILLTDVIGAHRVKGKCETDDSSYFFIYEYPILSIGMRQKRHIRQRKVYRLQVTTGGTQTDNIKIAAKWVETIRRRILPPRPPKDQIMLQRRLYVLVNPNSGQGRGLQIFQDQVMPVFAEANIVCKLVITERANHACDLVQELELECWDGIVIISGDGLVFEVLNGFMMREDREEALKMPIAIIPSGSGNALPAAICFQSGDLCLMTLSDTTQFDVRDSYLHLLSGAEPIKDFLTHCTLITARPSCYFPMKLIHIETDKGEHLAAFLSVSWGLLADIDIESEKFRRSLGGARFIPGAVLRVFGLRIYKGRVSYLPVEHNATQKQDRENQLQDRIQSAKLGRSTPRLRKIPTRTESVSFTNPPDDFSPSPSGGLKPGLSMWDLTSQRLSQTFRESSDFQDFSVERNKNDLKVEFPKSRSNSHPTSTQKQSELRDNCNNFLSPIQNNRHRSNTNNDSVQPPIVSQSGMSQTGAAAADHWRKHYIGTSGSESALANGLLKTSEGRYVEDIPRLSEPVPSSWKVLEDEFAFVTLVFLSHLGADLPYMPQARMDDDLIYLTMIRASNITKPQLMLQLSRFLLSLDSADHFKVPKFEVIPTRAVRIETITPGGVVAVDGEVVQCSKLQAVLTDYSSTIMGRTSSSLPSSN